MKSGTVDNLFDEHLRTDFKAEVIAAELIDSGLPPERIIILMLGAAKRSYRRDVESIVEEISEYDYKAYTHITTHKEGIYDMLPEGLFHPPTVPKSAKNEDDIVAAMKRHHVEEATARKFFLPFEAAINDLRIQMALYDNRLDKRMHNSDMIDVFANHWEIFNWLDARQANIFLHLLPLLHDLRDDYLVAATLFEMILDVPVKISLQTPQGMHTNGAVYSPFSNALLGVNFTTENGAFYQGEEEILIEVGPMPNAALEQFMPAGKNEKILALLCDYLLPVHLDVKIDFKLNEADRLTRLPDTDFDHNSVLGFSTYL